MQFTIEDITVTDRDRVEQAAMLLNSAFSPFGVWTTMAEARQEMNASGSTGVGLTHIAAD